ncbi:hypothetical protein ONZ45_g6994 [Pleurotus djamor]|nr:hypothetical protein ONZ45_g6994 [Pleurotus djamor]
MLCAGEARGDQSIVLKHHMALGLAMVCSPPLVLVLKTCAIGPDGQLLPASKIDFIYDPEDPRPMPAPNESRASRVRRPTDKAQGAIASLRHNEFGKLEPKFRTSSTRVTARSSKKVVAVGDEDDAEDTDFIPEADGEGSEDDVGEISNQELASTLPAKIVVSTKRPRGSDLKSSPPNVKRNRAVAEAGDPPPPITPTVAPTGLKSRAPIYLFFEEVASPMDHPFPKGERHYICYHDPARKELKVTAAMKHSTTGLVAHLRKFPIMYRFFEVLRSRKSPPDANDIEIAVNRKPMSAELLSDFVRTQEQHVATLDELFKQQRDKDKPKFNQDVFDKLLAEWMVSCDQPFTEVDRPELRALIQYLFQTGGQETEIRIPGHTTARKKIMKLGEDTIDEMVIMFSKVKSKVSLSLDAWTSSNQHAFLAIVAHFVNNDGVLEELLIDFKELIGSHSGANMAEAVWSTMQRFGLVGKVIAIVMDNASNNDTLMTTLEALHRGAGFDFPAKDARLRCIPHTIHLAALCLLEGIGALSPSDQVRAAGQEGGYQSVVTADDEDDDALFLGEDGDDLDDSEATAPKDDLAEISLSVARLRRIIRSIRSSPQRRGSWLDEVLNALRTQTVSTPSNLPLMLILDSKTRWSSTHYMLRRALHLKNVLNDFLWKNRDLRAYKLSDKQWDAIEVVNKWLDSFHVASVQMSSTLAPMLSTTLAMFRGLQEDLREIIASLPESAPRVLRDSLVASHLKLSQYYTKIDESPYYTWASLLDPRISYKTLKDDYKEDKTLTDYLETSKAKLTAHFNTHYKSRTPTPVSASSSSQSVTSESSRKDLLAIYRQRKTAVPESEIEAYWNLPLTDLDADPIQWWTARREQFPNLSQLAYDILGIPGNAVAVERIFSSARDTISLRRASLKPETIRTLMIYKQQIRRARSSK